MKKFLAALLVVFFLLILLSDNYCQNYYRYPINSQEWDGIHYSRNQYLGYWFPKQRANGYAFTTDDYSWGLLRSKKTVDKGTGYLFKSQIKLNSGGTNSDHAYFGFGNNWAAYDGNAAGICFLNNSIYLFKTISSNSPYPVILQNIGSYGNDETITFELTLNNDNSIYYNLRGKSGSFSPGFSISAPRLVMAVANSIDGYNLSEINKVIENNFISICPVDSKTWSGVSYSRNVFQGNWLPAIRNGSSTFSTDDYSWGLVQTRATGKNGAEVEFTVRIRLNSGGTNSDQAYFGFGDEWAAYKGKAAGLCFFNQKIYPFKTNSSKSQYPELLPAIATYSVNEVITFSITLNEGGSMSYSVKEGAGVLNHGFDIVNPKVVIGIANSTDGFNLIDAKLK